MHILEVLRGPKRARRRQEKARRLYAEVDGRLVTILKRWPDLACRDTDDKREPIFLFSAGWRSGSTLLQRMIVNEGEVLIWGEPYAHCDFVNALMNQLRAITDGYPEEEWFLKKNTENLTNTFIANLYPEMDNFYRAHRAFFRELLEKPALAAGRTGWGFKEVRLGTLHAQYLKWLFPGAKFLFLYRNPFKAYSSYMPYRCWFKQWPEEAVFTPGAFGRHWRQLTDNFLENYREVGGFLVRYEDLGESSVVEDLSEYLKRKVISAQALKHIKAVTPRASIKIPWIHYWILKREVQPTAHRLGYKADRC